MSAQAAEFEGVPPAFLWRPPRARSLLPQVTKVCQSIGRGLEPEQALAVDVLAGVKANGAPASMEGAAISPRQNLKTYVLENIVLTRMVDPTDPSSLFFWTSQQIDTCEETFLHFLQIFDNPDHPHMQRRFKRAITTNGKQEISLKSGKRLKFKARSEKSGQGFAGDVIVFDEAFALEDEHLGALLPTLSTRGRATVLYGSSAGHESSAVLRRIRDRGRRGGRGAPAYVEWCAPGSFDEPGCEMARECSHVIGSPGCALDRPELVGAANPMAGRRITWDYLRDERDSMPPLQYARERLGWWEEAPERARRRLTVEAWAACEVAESEIVGIHAFGVAVSWDRAFSAIAVAGRTAEGVTQVELVEYRRGTRWVAEAVKGLRERHPGATFGLIPTTPAGSLLTEIEGEWASELGAAEVIKACGGLANAVTADPPELLHLADPRLTGAMAQASTRDRGDGNWIWWQSDSAGDISPLVAVTVARWVLGESVDYDPLQSVW